MQLKGKKITVMGLARSGAGAANLLAELGSGVTVTDMKTEADLAGVLRTLHPSVKRELGGHPQNIFSAADMIVVSPGIPLDAAPLQAARAAGVRIIGELELAYRVARHYGVPALGRVGSREIPFLAITGSNGKSTTTTLVDVMLRKAGFRTLFGGNIGNALTEEIMGISRTPGAPPPDFIVAEVSSFQLEAIEEFRPRISAVLNITPDHLDRYHAMKEYALAKARIFENQGEGDFLILNADDPETVNLRAAESPVGLKTCFFSRSREVEGVFAAAGAVRVNLSGCGPDITRAELLRGDEIRIKGVHNLENAMAAAAMALLAGCSPSAVIDSLKEFPGLEHRLEFVRELDGVRYINDSKGTNTGAVVKSLESFPEPLILIAGGRDKAGDFSVLRPLVPGKVKAVVLIGEAAGKIRDALDGLTTTVMAADLRSAVASARELSVRGDVVLLSPACASFDMFADFEDRGRQFKKIVSELSA